MPEMLFYHLERDPLDRVLPALIEKSLSRGWRCHVQAGSAERRDALDALLWTYRDDSFIPHGTDEGAAGEAARQPVLLTLGERNVNGAQVRFVVDGAGIGTADGFERIVYMFDGADQQAVGKARETWTWAKAEGLEVTYWKQTEQGGWERKG